MASPERRIRTQRSEPSSDQSYPVDGAIPAGSPGSTNSRDPNVTGGGRPRSRRFSEPDEDTAQQITRLRQSVSRGVSQGSSPLPSPRQSMGRSHLSRSQPESDEKDIEGVDERDNASASRQPPETVYRPVSRRRVEASRESLSNARISSPASASTPSSMPLDDDDEPIYDDDDDFTEYDLPRGASRQRARSQRAVAGQPRPGTLPGLPTAISQADLVNDAAALSTIGVGLAGLAAMAILVANRAETLAPEFATHVSASGTLENFAHYTSLWRLPLLTAMLTLMNIAAAWFISPLDRFASRFLLAAAVVVQLVAWVALIRIL